MEPASFTSASVGGDMPQAVPPADLPALPADPPTRLSDLPVAEAALMDLCRPFAPPGFDPECAVVQPNEIPFPQDHLLVHHAHMTVVLEKHHGAPVERPRDGRAPGRRHLHPQD